MDFPDHAALHLITHEFSPMRGGIATFTEEMARAACALGKTVEVWAPRPNRPEDEQFPFPINRVTMKGSQDLVCQIRMARALHRRRSELKKSILHLIDPGAILAFALMQRLSRFQPAGLALTFHGSEILRFAERSSKRRRVARLIDQSNRISVLSEFTRDLLFEHFPNARGKTIVTPGALPERFEIPTRKTEPEAGNPIRILTVGRIHPRKGQLQILRALDALPPILARRVVWDVVGSGEKHGYARSLRDRIDESDIEVTLHGELSPNALATLYAQADIFALTSMPFRTSVEGFGLVYLEAAARGLPVVAHRIGGVPEAVSHGENGLLVEPDDLPGLTQAFADLIEDNALRQRLGQAGIDGSRRHRWIDAAERLYAPSLKTGTPFDSLPA